MPRLVVSAKSALRVDGGGQPLCYFFPAVTMRRRLVPGAVIAGAALVLALRLTAAAPAAASAPWVVFSAHPDGTALQQLFRVQSNGDGLQQISKGASPATDPSFSPDGKKLVFVRLGRGIYSIDLDGTNERRLTKNGRDSYPVWSPSGKQIAFLRPHKKQWTLFVMTSSGVGEHRLPQAPPGGRPAWTKDGKAILLPTVADVSRVDPRTGRILGRVDLQPELVSSTAAAVAPNGRSVAYIGRRPLTGPEDCGESPCPMFALYLVSTSRKKPLKIANGTGPATWLPDGKTLVYVTGGKLILTALPGGKSTSISMDEHLLAGDAPPAWQPR
jgi:Tol biopolymer transport system component